MGKLILRLLAIILMIVGTFGIIGGEISPLAPYYAFVQTHVSLPCGGTIVAADVVLTAAHCLYDFYENDWISQNKIVVRRYVRKVPSVSIIGKNRNVQNRKRKSF